MHNERLRAVVTPVVAVAICLSLGLWTKQPGMSGAERARLVSHFRFDKADLNGDPATARRIRTVQPGLRNIDAWISAVGAAVALADLDGDQLANDRCLVDPRDDSVTVAPVPGTGARYPSFALVPASVPYDAKTTAPMGCVPADYNEDGRIDLLVYYWGRSPVIFLASGARGAGTPGAHAFREVEAVTPVQVWNTNTLNVVDVDGDGHLDLVVGNYFPDGARVLDPAAADDPRMQMQASMSLARNGGRSRILRWTGAAPAPTPSVRFEDTRALSGPYGRSWTLATGAQDLNGDGRPELYFANDFGHDQLLLNRSTPGHVRLTPVHGRRDLTIPKSKILGNDSFKGMGVAFTQLNDDAVPDILVSNITSPYALEESNFAFVSNGSARDLDRGVAPYRDRSEDLGLSRSGWGWDIKAADFDNDGRDEILQAIGFLRGSTNRWPQLQELAIANDTLLSNPRLWPRFKEGSDLSGHEHNPFYVRTSSGRYADLSKDLGVGGATVSRGIATADVDADGRLDYAVANQWDRSTFYRNRGPATPYLGLRLRLPVAGDPAATRAAIGAAVTVTRTDGRVLTQQLYPANAHTGVSSTDLLFGLGDSPSGPVSVRVVWRDAAGLHEQTSVLEAGWHTVRLGTPAPTR